MSTAPISDYGDPSGDYHPGEKEPPSELVAGTLSTACDLRVVVDAICGLADDWSAEITDVPLIPS